MKKIEAIIKPFKLDEVKNALDEAGIERIRVSEVKGFGRQHLATEVFRGTRRPVDFLPEIKIELVLTDDHLDVAIAAIVKGARLGRTSEDQVFVSDIQDALHVDSQSTLAQAF